MNLPVKVSIITVTYNSEKYLSDCIASVRKQTYGNIEHIIVDGKSTDGTVKIIQKNAASLAHWISETDRGMYDAINKGIKMATGDIIGVLGGVLVLGLMSNLMTLLGIDTFSQRIVKGLVFILVVGVSARALRRLGRDDA